ncbi:serine hydrolase [Candidatus Daviesbacteria bacterium]|nr:serine hydrolase [Candidatus Daviesbacteria bacterium]
MDKNFIVGLKLKPRRKKKRLWVWILVFILAVFAVSATFKSKSELINPISKIRVDIPLKSVVENILADTKGTYGIDIKNLKSGESYFLNENTVFEAGSLYKLWVMATVYKQIQDGKLSMEQVLSEDVVVLNRKFNIDPEMAELTEGVVTYTVSDAIYQMITISHNYAALLLTEKIKLSTVANFLKENGFLQSQVGTDGDAPKSTASDIALFYEKLYKGELASEQYTQEMINLLKKQQLNDGLPRFFPDKTIVAHKTGDIGWFKHDAGIIYLPDKEASAAAEQKTYIIVVMSESTSPAGAQEKIALISKAVYEYFNNH